MEPSMNSESAEPLNTKNRITDDSTESRQQIDHNHDEEYETIDPPLSFKMKIQKYWKVLRIAKIEVAILFHMIAFKMFYLNLQNILLDQACRVNLNYPSDICDLLSKRNTDNLTSEEEEIQHYVADIIRWKSLIDNFFPLIFVLFVGAWSDLYGRKFLTLLPLFGYVAQTVGILLCLTIQPSTISANTIAWISAVPVALTGSIATLNMAVFSYIADITPIESRTIRTGITNAAFLLGMSLGNAFGGILSSYSWGSVGTLGICVGLDLFAFFWILVLIKNDNDETHKYQRKREETTKCGIVRDFFNLRNVFEAGKAVGKKREGNERLQLFALLFGCYFFITVPEYGEESVYYLFLRYRLNWSGLEYGYYSTYRLLIGAIGGLLVSVLLSNKMKLSDSFIGMICCVSHFSASFIYGLAKTSVVLCLGPLVGMWSSTMSLITKVIISKIVPTTEIGKIYSFIGCLDAVVPLIANPLYTTVYKATFENVLPGLFFFISATMTTLPIGVYTWLFFASKRLSSPVDDSP